jgi:hypothetical protein
MPLVIFKLELKYNSSTLSKYKYFKTNYNNVLLT